MADIEVLADAILRAAGSALRHHTMVKGREAIFAATRAAVAAGHEEAALACEQQARDFLAPEYAYPQPVGSIQERFACAECATAIRALSQQEKGK